MDKYERKSIIDKKLIVPPGAISVGITWVDGRVVFQHDKKWSQAYFGVCHYSEGVFLITPSDWDKATMLTTIEVEPTQQYCERAYNCLNFNCKLNRFDKGVFLTEFSDVGAFSLGLPQDVGTKPLWFSSGKWKDFWGKLCLHPEGGILRYDDTKN